MLIDARYLKDTKDRKWCPAALFSFLLKMLSLLLDPLVFPVQSWVSLNGLRRKKWELLSRGEKGAAQTDHISCARPGALQQTAHFPLWRQNWLSVLPGASNLTSLLLGFLISTMWIMLLPHMVVAKFKKMAHVRYLAHSPAHSMWPRMFALMM